MALKASNNMYVAINADSLLVADQPDASKAEVFEKVDQGNGKLALKTSKGKFVSDDRGRNNNLVANRVVASEWEQFEIIALGESKVNLKSSTGKMVCADIDMKGVLFANRDQASGWETFILEER